MIRFAPGFFGIALFVFWVWAVLDVIATDRILIRNLDKTVWLMLVIFVPTVGAVAWIALGRPMNAGFTPGSTASRTPSGSWQNQAAPRGVEDSEEWSARVTQGRESSAAKERRLLEWEAELKKREEALDDDSSTEE